MNQDSFNLNIEKIESFAIPTQILTCPPTYFDVVDVKNVYMANQKIVKELAHEQWNKIQEIYKSFVDEKILTQYHQITPGKDCEDMVFTANQSFPWIVDNEKVVIMSKMRHESREREVPLFREFYKSLNYKILELQQTQYFEGMGDTIPHPGKKLLYGGYGHRSDKNAYEEISQLLKVPIILLELINPKFYHLDTCFLPISQEAVLICSEAFKKEDLEKLKKLFKEVIEIPLEEAESCFALNAHCIGDKVIIQKGAKQVNQILKNHNYEVIEVETSEYMKSGGSVFCMKMMIY